MRSASDGLADARVRAAATEVRKRSNLLLRGRRINLQKCCDRHDETRFAITAHRYLLGQPRLLHGVRAIGGKPLDCGHARIFKFAKRNAAAGARTTIDDHRARPAIAAVAAIFGAGKIGRIAKGKKQGSCRIELIVDALAIDCHPDHLVKLARALPGCQDAAMPRILTSNGSAIGYVEAGRGQGAPIVFLHGVGSDKSVWHPQLEYFARTRQAIAFDYPGYGDSDPAPEGTTRDDYAFAILCAMHALGIERAHICGLSLGGVVAIAMHNAAPDRCASLVLADTFAVHPQGRAIFDRSIAASANLRAMAEARVDVLIAQPAASEIRNEVLETMSRIDPNSYRIGAEAVWLADQRDRAQAIKVPSLILVGDQDLVTPPELSNDLAGLIPHARMQVIANAGHLTNLEKAEEFNEIVDHFICEVEE